MYARALTWTLEGGSCMSVSTATLYPTRGYTNHHHVISVSYVWSVLFFLQRGHTFALV